MHKEYIQCFNVEYGIIFRVRQDFLYFHECEAIEQDMFGKHNALVMANSNEGQDHKDKYFDTTNVILSQRNDNVQYGSSSILF